MKAKNVIFLLGQFIMLNFFAIAQWNTNPSLNTLISAASNDQQDVRVVSDTKGGAIITWCDYRNNIANGDIYAQRINSAGVNKWTANGVAICIDANHQTAPSIIEDGLGGTIIVWQDWRNGNRDIYAQRVDSNGIISWTNNGVAVAVKTYEQQNPKHVSDGANGAIIVWQDSVNGNWDIYVQRIDSNGITQWTLGGVAICTAVGDQINPRIETDNQGGAIITWQDKRNGADYDIYARRVNSSGTTQWTDNGVSICSYSNSQINPKIEPDGSGGAIIVWQDRRNGSNYDIYAQRVDSNGIISWTNNGVPICTASGNQSAIDLTTENINGAIITWKDSRSSTIPVVFDIYAQLVDLSGAVQWITDGVAVCTAWRDQVNPNIIGDGAGGAIIVWEDDRESTHSDIYAQRINATGTIQWTNNGVATGTAANNQTSPKHTTDGNGGAIFVWQDKRSGNFDIYTHHFNSDGTASVNEFEEPLDKNNSIRIYPNPASNSMTIEIYDLRFTIYDLKIFDELGNVVYQFKIKNPQSEIHLDLPSGMYFYQIKDSNQFISTGKLIVINSSDK